MKICGVIKRDLGNGEILSLDAFEKLKSGLAGSPVRSIGVTVGSVSRVRSNDTEEASIVVDTTLDFPVNMFSLEPGFSFDRGDVEISEDDSGNVIRTINRARLEYIALAPRRARPKLVERCE